jgi:16S rRNA (guanine527-N7)-methyltransferase
MELIRKYFPDLPAGQVEKLGQLDALYRDWNSKINVISRKDIDALYLHHVLHSLVLLKYNPFTPGMQVLDAGTGGGFPGIPLAIVYPDVQFTLLDSTAKKIHVVKEVAGALELPNVIPVHARIEAHSGAYDAITSRAVSSLTQMVAWSKHLVPSKRWIILKGGDPRELRKELPPLFRLNFTPVNKYFDEPYFSDKYIIDIYGSVS